MATVETHVEKYATRVVKTKLSHLNLCLTPTEAIVLYKILGNIGGSKLNSARVFTNSLHDALGKALKNPSYNEIRHSGYIVFPEGSDGDALAASGNLIKEWS